MKLEDLKIYSNAMELGEEVWKIVAVWDYFPKDTIGKQWVKAVDSVAANISEGYGRYHFKEAKNFSYFSRGSLSESKTWLLKARNRDLVSEAQYKKHLKELEILAKMLNRYITSIGTIAIKPPMTNDY